MNRQLGARREIGASLGTVIAIDSIAMGKKVAGRLPLSGRPLLS